MEGEEDEEGMICGVQSIELRRGRRGDLRYFMHMHSMERGNGKVVLVSVGVAIKMLECWRGFCREG